MCAGMDLVWISDAAMDRTGWTAVIYFIEFIQSTWNSAARSSLCPRSWTGAALHLNSLCRGTWSAVWPVRSFGESETSKGRIVYLTSDRRRNCRARWAVATTSTHLKPDTMFALGIYLWETIVFFRYVSRLFWMCWYINQKLILRCCGYFTSAENIACKKTGGMVLSNDRHVHMLGLIVCYLFRLMSVYR